MVYCRENGIELGTQKITTRIMKLYITMCLGNILGNMLITDPPENQSSVSYRIFLLKIYKILCGISLNQIIFMLLIIKWQILQKEGQI